MDYVVIIDNSDNHLSNEFLLGFDEMVGTLRRQEQPPNLSALWNMGLEWVTCTCQLWPSILAPSQWDVAILNDDAIVPPGWFNAVSQAMRAFDAAAGCSDPDGTLHAPIHHRRIGPVGLDRRLVGYAFILAGEKGVRANEDLHWYFTDDHIDYASREAGGTVMIPGFPVQHLHPNGQISPEIAARIPIDAQNFKDRWGVMPW